MLSIERCDLPETSLLSVYKRTDAYTDCFATEIDRKVSQAEYIQAFYTTFLFKMERAILKWAVSKPSTDQQAGFLADAKINEFAAWKVEARLDDQILLCDYRGKTRSWLMSEPVKPNSGGLTRLYFGSAVVPTRTEQTEKSGLGAPFSVLLPFHRFYSRTLLASAGNKLSRQH